MKKICVIGNFSGRNTGDNSILECLLKDIYLLNKNIEFLIPTINPFFIKETYGKYPVRAVSMLPWNLSLKIFGLPIFKAVLQSDLVLLTDAILFDKKLWNPLFNYLSTMALVLPMAKKKNVPVVLYNSSIGPVTTDLGVKCLRRVVDSLDQVILRDRDSFDLLRDLRILHNDIKFQADCALNISLPTAERMKEINHKEKILEEKGKYLSFNINSYIDMFVKNNGKSIGFERFVSIIAETIDKVVEQMDKKVILVITQAMDVKIAKNVLDKLRNIQSVTMVTNKKYTHNELAGILSQVEMHVGMRTHSVILATSCCVPSLCIVYRPKNRGYMNAIDQKNMLIELDERFTSHNLFQSIKKTWNDRKKIKKSLQPSIAREKKKARESALFLEKYLK
jgi:polysaccharide pyruvyl transferase WcaK-like protein